MYEEAQTQTHGALQCKKKELQVRRAQEPWGTAWRFRGCGTCCSNHQTESSQSLNEELCDGFTEAGEK